MKSIGLVHRSLSNADMGGVSVLYKTLAEGLTGRGWQVHLVSTYDCEKQGVISHKLPVIRNPWLYSRMLSEFLATLRLDILECSNWKFELLSYALSGKRTSKVVVRCDPSASILFDEPGLAQSEALLCQKADLLLAVSKFARNNVQSEYKLSGVDLVYNGISFDYSTVGNTDTLTSGEIILPHKGSSTPIVFLPLSEVAKKDMINVFWVGKPNKMKGFDYLERIVESAPENFNFIINIGFAPFSVTWSDMNLKRCIFVRGLTRQDQINLWRRADVFLATSRVEGFCLAMAEALFLGLPIVANSECEVFTEFIPNEAISMVDVSSCESVVESLSGIAGTKAGYSRLPEVFYGSRMVEDSIKHYEAII